MVKSDLKDALNEFLKELTNHSKIDNPFILKLLGFSLGPTLMIITKYQTNGSLHAANLNQVLNINFPDNFLA